MGGREGEGGRGASWGKRSALEAAQRKIEPAEGACYMKGDCIGRDLRADMATMACFKKTTYQIQK